MAARSKNGSSHVRVAGPTLLALVLALSPVGAYAGKQAPRFLRSLPREQGRQVMRETDAKLQGLKARGDRVAAIIDINEVLLVTGETGATHGARRYTDSLIAKGITPVLISGRPEQYRQDIENKLRRYGFQVDRMKLYLNPGKSTLEWKEMAARQVAKEYTVGLAIDNEIKNVQLFARMFPKADIWRLNTGYWDRKGVDPDQDPGRIKVLKQFHHHEK